MRAKQKSLNHEKVEIIVFRQHFILDEHWENMKLNEPGRPQLKKAEFLTAGKARKATSDLLVFIAGGTNRNLEQPWIESDQTFDRCGLSHIRPLTAVD